MDLSSYKIRGSKKSPYEKARRSEIAHRQKMVNLKPLVNKLENVKKSKKVNRERVAHSTNLILSGLAYLTNGGKADLFEVLHAVGSGAQEVVFNQSSKLRKITNNLKKERGTQLTSKNRLNSLKSLKNLSKKNQNKLKKYRKIYRSSSLKSKSSK